MAVEDLLFQMFKDTRKLSTNKKRELMQLKFPNIDMSYLHRKVVNYQVEKYGQSLS